MQRTLAVAVGWSFFIFLVGCGDESGGDVDASYVDAALEDALLDATPRPDSHPYDLTVTMETYPNVDGSTSTLPLARVIACELLGIGWDWVADVGDEGIAEVLPVATNADEVQLATAILEQIVHNKTHQSYLNLIDGVADLILVANPPSEDETAYADAAGVTLDQRHVGLDALVILVNEENPVSSLTNEQIRGIFMGEITDWSEVGAPAGAIQPYVRPINSGSQQLMNAIVMEGLTMPDWPEDRIPTMGGLIDTIKDDPLAIGYSVYFYVTNQYPAGGYHVIAVDSIVPDATTIGSETYRYVAPVWVMTRTDLESSELAYQMRDWLLEPEGQSVVSMSGYVALP